VLFHFSFPASLFILTGLRLDRCSLEKPASLITAGFFLIGPPALATPHFSTSFQDSNQTVSNSGYNLEFGPEEILAGGGSKP
jgi:hypothetical protein